MAYLVNDVLEFSVFRIFNVYLECIQIHSIGSVTLVTIKSGPKQDKGVGGSLDAGLFYWSSRDGSECFE